MQETESLIEVLRANRKLSKNEGKTDLWENSIDKHLEAAKKNVRTRREIVERSVDFHDKAKKVRIKLFGAYE